MSAASLCTQQMTVVAALVYCGQANQQLSQQTITFLLCVNQVSQ